MSFRISFLFFISTTASVVEPRAVRQRERGEKKGQHQPAANPPAIPKAKSMTKRMKIKKKNT